MPNYKKVNDCVRDLIIKGYEDGVFASELAKTFDVNLFTVRSIITRYRKFGNAVRPRGRRKKLLDENQINQIKDYLDQDCQRTLQEICDYAKEKFDIEVSVPTMYLNLCIQKTPILN